MAEQKKPRVIVADDELHLRLLMKKVMASMNCEVVGEAKNGEEAVALYREMKPDLMLLDINMPVKTGIEALGDITGEFPDAFIIMLTSVADMDSVEQCISCGAANYIRKDTPMNEIRDLIRETWKNVRQR